VQTINGVARIAITRPEKKSAITVAMYQEMADAIGAAHDDGAVRAILIHGERDVCTAGNDLEDYEAKSFEKLLRDAEAKEAFTAFFERRKPDFSSFS
jgi:enoyl-CoA hydratase/carnithine racemase